MRKAWAVFIFLLAVFIPAIATFAAAKGEAPDSTLNGPHQVASGQYRFPATIDPDILSDRQTEIWAKVFYPKDILQLDKAPLVVLLHGNHGTCGKGANPRQDTSCEYTQSGSCPTGYVVVPNHEGYDYLAENLASWGFWVVSINANRGITCGGGISKDSGLNLARGRLVLKHLGLLYAWSTLGGAPSSLGLGTEGLKGKIDFTSVGLLGHSRGGEGMRAAYNLYLDQDSVWPARIPGLTVKALFEIGAVDRQTSRVLDANGTVWNQLLPMCDGDVSDLQGRYPFERMLLNRNENAYAQKSLYEVWGANHNFFNTEWQVSDSNYCALGKPIFDKTSSYSKEQQTIALASASAFFRSHLGPKADKIYNQNFNPLNALPSVVNKMTQIDRDFTPSPGALSADIVEDFDKATGINSSGNTNVSQQVRIEHRHLVSSHSQRVALISWEAANDNVFFEAIWATPSSGRSMQSFATLDFRVARPKNALNKDASTDFSIQLEDAKGKLSNTISVSDYALINGPGTSSQVLQAVRIPLQVFQGVDLSQIKGVKFVFNKTTTGAIYLANVRIHKSLGIGEAQAISKRNFVNSHIEMQALPLEHVSLENNSLRVVQYKSLNGNAMMEIIVSSKVPFPAMNSLPVLKIGDKNFTLSRYSDMKELKELTFTLTAEEYQSIQKGSNTQVYNGKVWELGRFAK